MATVDLVLCGAGRMGRHHLRVAREHPRFRVVAIVDPALAGGALDGVPVVDSLTAVPPPFGAAIVATPIATHHAIVRELLARGAHVLVEKPLAGSVAECEDLVAHAAAHASGGARVAIGHVERFNPAVRALAQAVPRVGVVRRLSFVRVGTARGGVRERSDVLLELAVHDLDLLERLGGRSSLRSSFVQSFRGDEVCDAAELELVTASGATATVRVDACSASRARTIRVEGTDGALDVDLLAGSVELSRGGARQPLLADGPEPLRAQLDSFAAFLDGAPSEVCTVDEAARSVELALTARRLASGRAARVEGRP
ncbi:MAG: Gfo/Idh/MocA family oxidoreductase [Deltaproteobacteria bacterium]|nr:Gfo/Idh/MocA family oxidoreductase [Deltaproteobacteria bacterium]